MQLVDGNSVNYAESSEKGKYHTELDSDWVSKYDPEVSKKVGDKWENPSTSNNDADYFNGNESEKKANDKLKGNQHEA